MRKKCLFRKAAIFTIPSFLVDTEKASHGREKTWEAVLAGKINPLPKDEPYPEGAPRVAQSGAAEAVRANAALAKDEEVRKSLERLADALRR